MTTGFTNIATTTASTSKLVSGIWSLYEKQSLILNELKTSLMLKFSLQKSLQSFESLYSNFAKKFVKKILTLSYPLNSPDLSINN